MFIKKSIIPFLLTVALILSYCNNNKNNNKRYQSGERVFNIDMAFEKDPEDIFSSKDKNPQYADNTSFNIVMNNSGTVSDTEYASVSGNIVTITAAGTYVVSGNIDDGMIIVNASDTEKVYIILDGLVMGSSSSPIYVRSADKVFITLVDSSVNKLSNCGEFTQIDESNLDAVIFSRSDLTINGNGYLEISSPSGHGIVSKDDLTLTGGSYILNCSSHALNANDCLSMSDVTLNITSGKDGIHCDNSDDPSKSSIYIENGVFNIDSDGDGISSSAHIQINGGEFDIFTGGGSANAEHSSSGNNGGFPGGGGGRPRSLNTTDTDVSMKGVKSEASLLIKGGIFKFDTEDDSIHSNESIIITGGSFEISAGDDAIHADEILAIRGGEINIAESYEGLEGLNIEVSSGDIKIVSSDDGINAAGGNDSSGMGGMRPGQDKFGSSSNGKIVITGGTLYINASGDGIDSNGSLTMSGGYVTICGPTQGDTAVLDYDTTAEITGGVFIGTGSYMMAQTFSSSTQGVIALSVGNQSADTVVKLNDSKGNTIIEFKPKLSFAIVIISTPKTVKGNDYTIYVGNLSGTFEAS